MTDIARPQTDRDRSCEAATTSMQAGHSLKFNPTPFDTPSCDGDRRSSDAH
jgi:hypothetical protein